MGTITAVWGLGFADFRRFRVKHAADKPAGSRLGTFANDKPEHLTLPYHRWTYHPAVVTMRDNQDYIKVLV